MLTPVVVPDSIDELRVRQRLLHDFGVEIGGAFGPLEGRIWRIGTMGYSASRRNVLTCGVALNHLVGREFCIGEVRLRGLKLCEPCSHLEKVTAKKVIAALRHRGGLRAEILVSGAIRVGDVIAETDSQNL